VNRMPFADMQKASDSLHKPEFILVVSGQ